MGIYINTATSLTSTMRGVDFNTAAIASINKYIEWSEAEINKYLSKRYDLSSNTFQTTTSVPPLVRSWCERLVPSYYYQFGTRGGKEQRSLAREMRKDVIDNLMMVRDYKMDLVNTAGSVITDFSNTAYRCLSNTDDYTPTFNEDDPLNWEIDPDKLDDIASERT